MGRRERMADNDFSHLPVDDRLNIFRKEFNAHIDDSDLKHAELKDSIKGVADRQWWIMGLGFTVLIAVIGSLLK